MKVVGEKLPSDSFVIQPFLRKLTERVKENQHYSEKLMLARETIGPGRKTSEETVTFLAYKKGNDTHNINMMVIRKARNPRAFKNCASLPVEYYSIKNIWTTSTLFIK